MSGYLKIKVVEGRKFRTPEDEFDPINIIPIIQFKFKNGISTTNPTNVNSEIMTKWDDEVFIIKLEKDEAYFEFQVYNGNINEDNYLGEARIPMTDFKDEEKWDDWYTFHLTIKKKHEAMGEIHIIGKYVEENEYDQKETDSDFITSNPKYIGDFNNRNNNNNYNNNNNNNNFNNYNNNNNNNNFNNYNNNNNNNNFNYYNNNNNNNNFNNYNNNNSYDNYNANHITIDLQNYDGAINSFQNNEQNSVRIIILDNNNNNGNNNVASIYYNNENSNDITSNYNNNNESSNNITSNYDIKQTTIKKNKKSILDLLMRFRFCCCSHKKSTLICTYLVLLIIGAFTASVCISIKSGKFPHFPKMYYYAQAVISIPTVLILIFLLIGIHIRSKGLMKPFKFEFIIYIIAFILIDVIYSVISQDATFCILFFLYYLSVLGYIRAVETDEDDDYY